MLARWSARGVERWLWALFALAAALISIWFGAGLLDRSLETRLIKEVLFEWQRLGQRFSVEGANWPEFKGNNHVVYMEALLKQMQHQGQVSPRQARQLSYTPRLKRMGRTDERLFLLLLPGRLVIFGLPKETFARIDNRVDGVFDPARGDFTGRPASDSTKMIGYWRL
jgi:uncharacterized protein (DUF58 family)